MSTSRLGILQGNKLEKEPRSRLGEKVKITRAVIIIHKSKKQEEQKKKKKVIFSMKGTALSFVYMAL
jgi:hypothetical protein